MKYFNVVAAALLASLTMGPVVAQDKLKVGFIYVGPIGDHGWSYQHDQGRLAIEAELGDAVETLYIEKVAEGADAERAITRLARQGAKLIFTTSFGYMESTQKVAERFPEVKFEHATGYKRGDNVSTYSARFLRRPLHHWSDCRPHVENRRRRLHRLLSDSRGRAGYQLIHARCAVRQSGLQAENRLGQFLV